MFRRKKKELSEADKRKAEKNVEDIRKLLQIEAIHLREAVSEEYDQDLNILDKIRISNSIRKDDRQKKKDGIKRDFLDEVKDVSQITHDYKHQKYLKRKRLEYGSDEDSIPTNDLFKNSYGEHLIIEARRNLQNNVGIDTDQMIKNHKIKKAERAKKAGCSTVLAILSFAICFIFFSILF